MDKYERKARLRPGLILGLPLSTLVAVVFIAKPAWWTAVTAVVVASGLTLLFAEFVRSRGRAVEPQLWASWGGPPSTVALRYTGAANTTLIERRHRVVQKAVPDEPLPDQATEVVDRKAADDRYEAAVTALRARTRDTTKFGLLFAENCSYGFRRNLYGCKRYGFVSIAFSIAGCVAIFLADTVWDRSIAVPVSLVVVIVLDLSLAVTLWLVVTAGWVREAADAYARQLFDAAELL